MTSILLCALCVIACGSVSFAANPETDEIVEIDEVNTLSTVDVSFHVTDGNGSPIADAQLSIDGVYVGSTDSEGSLSAQVESGTAHSYSIEKDGYVSVSETHDGFSAGISVVMNQQFNVTFTVSSDGGMPLRNAVVTVDGSSKATNGSGVAVFPLQNGDYSYEVVKEFFPSVATGSIAVNGSDIAENVQLTGGCRVEFIVKNDAGKAVDGAEIAIEGTNYSLVTNSAGVAYAWLNQETYNFTVTDADHKAAKGSLIVNGSFTEAPVALERKEFSVIFEIRNEQNEPLEGAKVRIDGDVGITNAKGRVRMSSLACGAYRVAVTDEGYTKYTGKATVSSTNREIEIVLKKAAPTPAPTAEVTPIPTSGSGDTGSAGGTGTGGSTGSGGSSSSKGTGSSGGSGSKSSAEPAVSPSASATAPATVKPTPAPTAAKTAKPTPMPTPEPTYNIGFTVMDTNWNPIADKLTELRSEPKIERTDENGVVFFQNVKKGKHTFYVKNDDGSVLAQKEFEIVPSGELDLEPSQSGIDILYMDPRSTTVAVDALLNGDKLSLVRLHEEEPQAAVSEEVKNDAEDKSDNIFVLLAVCIACLIVALAILFAATRLIGKKNTSGNTGKWFKT